MQTEPEQWAVELLEAVHDASDMGSACGMVDCPQCKAAALTIQRAFEERERKLREALELSIRNLRKLPPYALGEALPDFTHVPRIHSNNSVSFEARSVSVLTELIKTLEKALKETPDAQ